MNMMTINYFDELHDKDDSVLVLVLEGVFCLYMITQILFIR